MLQSFLCSIVLVFFCISIFFDTPTIYAQSCRKKGVLRSIVSQPVVRVRVLKTNVQCRPFGRIAAVQTVFGLAERFGKNKKTKTERRADRPPYRVRGSS
jgi:hypothetical protein